MKRDTTHSSVKQPETENSIKKPRSSSSFCARQPSLSSNPKRFDVTISTPIPYSKPTCIGEFSLDISRSPQPGRSQLRYFYEPVLHNRSYRSQQLIQGIETFIRKENKDEGLLQLLRWILTMAKPNSSLKKTIHECDFVVWRGTLARLMVSPYDVGPYSVGVKVAFCKFKGVYFIHECDTQAKTASEAFRNDYQVKMSYAGFKFEQMVTVDKQMDTGNVPNVSAPVDQNNEFVGIFTASLNGPIRAESGVVPASHNGDIRLFYGAEIDCISNSGQFLEIKTQFKSIGYGKGFTLKALKWWVQSYLVGIKQMMVGLHENFTLNRVQLLPIEWLAKHLASNGYKIAVCFAFLHSFLQTVRSYLDNYSEDFILVAERAPFSHEFKFSVIDPESEEAKSFVILDEKFKTHGWL